MSVDIRLGCPDQALLQPWGRARVKPSKGTTGMRSPSLGKAPGGSSKG